MAKKKDKEDVWRTCTARKLLKDDIIMGRVLPQMDATEVYATRTEFMKFPLKRFKPNLQNLRAAIARDYRRMCRDCEFYGHDLALLKEIRANDLPRAIPWHKSDAKPLLEKDIQGKVHLNILENGEKLTPKQFYQTRVEYRAFTLDVFRNHIYQELKRLEKNESKIRFGKKKKRLPATEALPHLLAMIDPQEED